MTFLLLLVVDRPAGETTTTTSQPASTAIRSESDIKASHVSQSSRGWSWLGLCTLCRRLKTREDAASKITTDDAFSPSSSTILLYLLLCYCCCCLPVLMLCLAVQLAGWLTILTKNKGQWTGTGTRRGFLKDQTSDTL